jgi:hypothetical protein
VGSDSVRFAPLLHEGTLMRVTDGPRAGSGYWWYEIIFEDDTVLRGGRKTGWVAAADHDGTPWLGRPDEGMGPDTDPVPEGPVVPDPILVLDGAQETVWSDGTPFTRYDLSITNWAEFPAELFEPVGVPCGLAPSSSRTWVQIIDVESDNEIYAFCGLNDSSDLNDIWFPVMAGSPPPALIYVRLWDQFEYANVDSNKVRPSTV